MTDMQVKGSPCSLHPGDPQCAPFPAVKTEALSSLLRTLHAQPQWNSPINTALLERLGNAGRLADRLSVGGSMGNGEGKKEGDRGKKEGTRERAKEEEEDLGERSTTTFGDNS